MFEDRKKDSRKGEKIAKVDWNSRGEEMVAAAVKKKYTPVYLFLGPPCPATPALPLPPPAQAPPRRLFRLYLPKYFKVTKERYLIAIPKPISLRHLPRFSIQIQSAPPPPGSHEFLSVE